LDLLSQFCNEFTLVQWLHLFKLDFLILEPIGGVDDHAEAKCGFNLGIKKTILEHPFPLIPKALFERPVISTQTTIGDEEEPRNRKASARSRATRVGR
jgi:hypothetical protein